MKYINHRPCLASGQLVAQFMVSINEKASTELEMACLALMLVVCGLII
jgi:hypothetical protein